MMQAGTRISDLLRALGRAVLAADALARFAEWLRHVSIPKLCTNWQHVFEPVWVYADHRAIRSFLRWAFHEPRSPFLPLRRLDDHRTVTCTTAAEPPPGPSAASV